MSTNPLSVLAAAHWSLARGRDERAALGWAAVWLVAPLACCVLLTGCAPESQPTSRQAPEPAQPAGPEGPDPRSDPEAITVAERMLEAIGGWQAWERTRYLRFGFVVEQEGERAAVSPQHLWDRWTSDYRLEGGRRIDGRPSQGLVLLNLDSHEGSAYTRSGSGDWVAVSENAVAAWLDWAHGRFINDTYWLLMPYKLQDKGVILKAAPSETIDGVEYNVVHLSFDKVGRTPGDQYWAFIDPKTWLMARWGYVLQGTEPPRTEWAWTEWEPYGRLMLSRTKVLQDPQRQVRIIFDPLAVLESLDPAVFSNPAVPMPNQP
ncbi:MAG: hypothetical protein ACE5HV_07290 [Acidobacteriota bacterium]